MSEFKRINSILKHPIYQDCLKEIQRLETDRKFCGHSIDHFMEVARLMYIFALEDGVDIEREIIYAAALLHDIGRSHEYLKGIEHHKASAELAAEILPVCGFMKKERDLILRAIQEHRQFNPDMDILSNLLYRADKKSRKCYCCAVFKECKWPDENKNYQLEY